MPESEATERWGCLDCGHTEKAPAGEVAGEEFEQSVGYAEYKTTITAVRCPECESALWLAESSTAGSLGHRLDGWN